MEGVGVGAGVATVVVGARRGSVAAGGSPPVFVDGADEHAAATRANKVMAVEKRDLTGCERTFGRGKVVSRVFVSADPEATLDLV